MADHEAEKQKEPARRPIIDWGLVAAAILLIVLSVIYFVQGRWKFRDWVLEGDAARIASLIGLVIGIGLLAFELIKLERK